MKQKFLNLAILKPLITLSRRCIVSFHYNYNSKPVVDFFVSNGTQRQIVTSLLSAAQDDPSTSVPPPYKHSPQSMDQGFSPAVKGQLKDLLAYFHVRVINVGTIDQVGFMSMKAIEENAPYMALVDLHSVLPFFNRQKVVEMLSAEASQLSVLPDNTDANCLVSLLYDKDPNWLMKGVQELAIDDENGVNEPMSIMFNSTKVENLKLLDKRQPLTTFASIQEFYRKYFNIYTCGSFDGTFKTALLQPLACSDRDFVEDLFRAPWEICSLKSKLISFMNQSKEGVEIRNLLLFIRNRLDKYKMYGADPVAIMPSVAQDTKPTASGANPCQSPRSGSPAPTSLTLDQLTLAGSSSTPERIPASGSGSSSGRGNASSPRQGCPSGPDRSPIVQSSPTSDQRPASGSGPSAGSMPSQGRGLTPSQGPGSMPGQGRGRGRACGSTPGKDVKS